MVSTDRDNRGVTSGPYRARVIREGAPPWRWLVVRTKPRRERVALANLEHRGSETYCPMYLEPPWHRRAPKGPTPLFPGYVFVRCAPLMEVNAIRYCPGVLSLVAFDRRLATVSQALVDELRRREAERGYVLPPEAAEGIPKGARVRVMAGPMAGMEALFTGYVHGRDRARILMEFLRRPSTVEVDAGVLEMVRVNADRHRG